jgi:hypothetical protein
MTKEEILKKIKDLEQRQESAKQIFHQCVGAIAALQEVLMAFVKKEDINGSSKS